jgi:hypothetical protein
MGNMIRSANGVMIDMDALRTKGENTIAVGNMNVNARGDVVVAKKEQKQTRQQRMRDHYELHSVVPKRKAVKASSADVVPARRQRDIDQEVPQTAPVAAPRGSLASLFTEPEQQEQPKDE